MSGQDSTKSAELNGLGQLIYDFAASQTIAVAAEIRTWRIFEGTTQVR